MSIFSRIKSWIFERWSKEWWSLTRILAFSMLLIGLLGEMDGPIPYVPGLYEFYKDISSELIGIGIGVLLIDTANERRQKVEYTRHLINTIRAGVLGPAESALHELRNLGKLDLLQSATFYKINLSGAKLFYYKMPRVQIRMSDFSNSKLMHVDLSNSNLESTDFSESRLQRVNFTDSILSSTSFRHSRVEYCNFSGCQIGNADFRDADLWGCNLKGAELIVIYYMVDRKTQQSPERILPVGFSTGTTLPNGEKWDPETMNLEYMRDTYGCIIDAELVRENMNRRLDKVN